jgi:hypothetical protein
MNEYYISKEDWNTILELGVDDKKDQIVAKSISTATKSALMRKWVVVRSLSFRSPLNSMVVLIDTMQLST